MSVSLICRDVRKRFGSQAVLEGIAWTVPAGCIAGLVGTSAAGKSTLLRIIAGLEHADSGGVVFSRGDSPSPRPRIGMTFQNLALWPHLNARQHLASVLRVRVGDRAVDELLEEVGLPRSSWDKRPAELSGGEGQRLALARALAVRPELLLLDEPLAQLDTPWRDELLGLIRDSARRHSTTVIYVTHSWRELQAICDRVAVLVEGRMVQEGPTDEVFQRPASVAIARLTGPLIVIPRRWLAQGQVIAPADFAATVGEEISLRPQQLCLTAPTASSRWRIESARALGSGWEIRLECLIPETTAGEGSASQCPGLRFEFPAMTECGGEVGLSIHAWDERKG